MVEAVVERRKCLLYIREVQHPSRIASRFPADINSHMKTVAVQARTFVTFGNIGQAMRSFEMKIFVNFGNHGENSERQARNVNERIQLCIQMLPGKS